MMLFNSWFNNLFYCCKDTDTPLIQHAEGKEGLTRQTSSRGGSGRKLDLSNIEEGPVIERRSTLHLIV